MIRIGIDVGGTNTDAVMVDGERVIYSVKTATTEDVNSGMLNALHGLMEGPAGKPAQIAAVTVGTTHFTNAVVQRRDLMKVAAVRIGLPASASLTPFIDWPDDLADTVNGGVFQIHGGHEYDGRELVPFAAAEVEHAASEINRRGIRSVAVCAVFSPLNAAGEIAAAEILERACPGIAVTRSHELGRIGLLERENVALLNASLQELALKTTDALVAALAESGIDAPLFLTQNDGTVMLAAMARRFPVYSFASGPTNSMRGAAFLTGLADAMVVDVGGTTTDIGYLSQSFPRQANNVVEIGGVRTLFRMPDLLSIGLGGGSLIHTDPLRIGPDSVGYRLSEKARVFGGSQLTATDIGVAAGLASIGDPSKVADLDPQLLSTTQSLLHRMVEDAADRMKVDANPVPLIAVGGGAFLIPPNLDGVTQVVRVAHNEVANAIGAAIAQVSGEVDQVFAGLTREAAIGEATELATQRAVTAGARRDSIAVVEVEDLPIAYLPGDCLRVHVRVVGDID